MKLFWKIVPWLFVALFAIEMVAVLMPKKDGEFHTRQFGRLPVLLNGRIQPIDSVARNTLLQIRSTGDVPLEQVPSWKFWHHPKKLRSTEWLLEVIARPDLADTRPIFLIHHAELLGQLRLQDKGIEKSGLRYYTFNELKPVYSTIMEESSKAFEVKSELQTPFQKQAAKLGNAVILYQRLKTTVQPEGVENLSKIVAEFQKHLGAAQEAAQASEAGKEFDKEAIARVAGPLRIFQHMADGGYALIVPPRDPKANPDNWQNIGTSLLESARNKQVHPAVTYYAAMADAYSQNKADEFNRAIEGYRQWLKPDFEKALQKGRAEYYYNQVKAFLHAMIIYIFAFVLAGGALLTFAYWPTLSESLRRSAFYLVVLAGLVHTFGLVFRMVLEGRPPVTNLYSSAIFIGWGTMVLGLFIERIFRVGLGSAVAALAGFITLMIAHNLALGGDTMEMLQAVLDTNFWLATHVVTITLGYSAMFFAGTLGIIYILLGVFTPLLRQQLGAKTASPDLGKTELGKALGKMVYGVICFATFFSFIGTVLGGIWADQSWGRFWGWDPKENGALLIVLWCAIILHARWGGMAGDRGLMNLAIFGNVITSFSWFGVNMLGIGLHSYGFMDEAFKWLTLFTASQLAIIGLGLLPLHIWRSFRASEPTSTPPPKGGVRALKPA